MGKVGGNMLTFRELRARKRVSIKEMADDLGIHYMSVRRYENGEGVPNVLTAIKIAKYFGVLVEEIDWGN